MKMYSLKTSDGEIINRIEADSIKKAVLAFAKIKKISIPDLLNIFKIEEM